MFAPKVPSLFIFGARPGLIIGDDEVSLAVWKGGELRQVEKFSNDERGLSLFREHLAENPYRNKGFFVIANVIGEDFRREHIAHLSRADAYKFHNQRMRSLFRGSSLFMSETQGREYQGRRRGGKREDIVLFYGVLAANKVDPWLVAIAAGGGRYLTGVHGMPQVISYLRSFLPKYSGDSVLVTFHESDTLRLTFFDGAKLRFSRPAKVARGADIAVLADTIKKELERTLKYLNSAGSFVEGKMVVNCVCPGGMTGDLERALPSAGRLEYSFYSADALHERVGIKKPLVAAGSDSSLHVDALCKRIILRQLAPQRQMFTYWGRLGANVAALLFCLYGAYTYSNAASIFTEGYFRYTAENDEMESSLIAERAGYQQELSELGDKPSTGENVRAIASTFNTIEAEGLTPTRLLYYLSGALAQNAEDVDLDNVKWYVSPEAVAPASDGAQMVSGEGFYQILEVAGRARGGNQREVAANGRRFADSFEERGDIHIEVLAVPPENLGILADEDTPLERGFSLRFIWRDGEDFPPDFDPRAEENEEGEAG